MATDEKATDRLCGPPGGRSRSTGDGDDDELLLYLYEKSSDSRAKCYDCVSMGGLAGMSRDTSEAAPGVDRELLSRSTDQICSQVLSIVGTASAPVSQVPGVVRSCRSQENYMELSDMICVDIDIDENLASSVDALHYRESVVSKTSDSSGSLGAAELECENQTVSATTPEDSKTQDEMVNKRSTENVDRCFYEQEKPTSSLTARNELPSPPAASVAADTEPNEDVDTCFDDEGELQGRTCLKDADRPSAGRLAKRLFYLQGFRKSDVSPHLTKKSVISTC